MPIYEFVCQECGVRYEHVQSFSATTLPACPSCQSKHVARMLGRPAIHFKGSGWYITDSKNASKSSALSPAEGAEKKPDSSTGTGEASAPKGTDSTKTEPTAAASTASA
jgi:putative FmdB family regulatory protein